MSNPGAKQQMRNFTPPGSAPQNTNSYRPSVPISVYRELAAELQSAQEMLDSLNSQNQQLARQNQQLRQEIERVVQSHLHLQQLVASFQTMGALEAPPARSEVRSEPTPAATVRRPRPAPSPPPVETSPPPPPPQMPEPVSPYSEKVVTEQQEGRYRRPTPPQRSSEVNGWWLVAAILLIVATAFGTGFLIVRPLLKGGR